VWGVAAFLLAVLIYLPLTGFPTRRPGPLRIAAHAACAFGCAALATLAIPDAPLLVVYSISLTLFAAFTTVKLTRSRQRTTNLALHGAATTGDRRRWGARLRS
jgi:hypothetical protein